MAKDRTGTDIEKVGQNLPSFLTDYKEDDSLDKLKTRRVLPRLKIIQAQVKDQTLKKEFGEGATIVHPMRTLVAPIDESFLFVPLYYYIQYCKWADYDDNSQPGVLDQSYDSDSEIARKWKNKNTRLEEYPGGPPQKPWQYQYLEHLRFPGVLYGGDLHMQPVVLSFERGEHGTGETYGTATTMRRLMGQEVPLWSQVWSLKTSLRTTNYTWYGFDYSNPPQDPFIDDTTETAIFHKLAEEFKQQYKDKLLDVDYSDAHDPVETIIEDAEVKAEGL